MTSIANTLRIGDGRTDGIFGRFRGEDTLAIAALALGLLLALLLLDGAALVRLGQVQRALRTIDARAGALPAAEGEASVIDFGLGSEGELLEELAPAAAVYRDRQRVTRVFRGDVEAASKALVGAMALELLGLCLALGFLTGIFPALQATRLRVADALRRM